MTMEGVLLRIERRYDSKELSLPFSILIDINKELREIGFITTIYLEEANKLALTEDDKSKNEEMLNTNIDYDVTTYLKIVNSEEIKEFFKSNICCK